MKKFLSIIVLVTLFLVSSCGKTDTSSVSSSSNPSSSSSIISSLSSSSVVDPNIALIEAAYDALALEGLNNVTSRVVLPGKGLNNVTITWSSSDKTYISDTGIVTRPSYQVGNREVTLTATLTLGSLTRIKTFVATVIAEDDPTQAIPSLYEKFDYVVGSDLDDQTTWSVTKGGGTALIVDSVPGNNMPSPKAIKAIENSTSDTHYERSIEVSDVTVMEFYFLQVNEGAAVNFELLNGSTRVFSVGLNRKNSFLYRDSAGSEQTVSGKSITSGVWYKARLEIDMVILKYKFYYYDYATDTSLVELTPTGGVSFPTGATAINMLRIRTKNAPISGTSTYITEIKINKLIAFAPSAGVNPNRSKALGKVEGFVSTVALKTGDTLEIDNIKVYNRFNSGQLLAKDVDYTLTITGDVDTNVAGDYVVTYKISLIGVSDDVITLTKNVSVTTATTPNEILTIKNTVIKDGKFSVDGTLKQNSGTLYYLLVNSGSIAPTAEQIKTGTDYGIVAVAKAGNVSLTALTFNVDIPVDSVGYDIYIVVHDDVSGYSEVASVKNINTYYTVMTALDLNNMAKSGSSEKYVLGADINGTGYSWIGSTTTFKGTLDGQGHKISNFTFTPIESEYGGLFHQIDGATIKNVEFENITVNNSYRSGILAGVVKGSTVEKVIFTNCSVTIDGESYAGIVASRVSGNLSTFRLITVINSSVTVTAPANYAGGFIGYAESLIDIEDVYCDVTVVENNSDKAQMVGGLIGRVSDKATAVNVKRVVIKVSLNGNKNVGGVVGKIEANTNISDVVVMGNIASGNNYAGSICGNGSITTHNNTYEVDFVGNDSNGTPAKVAVTMQDIQTETWWTTNLPSFDFTNVWKLESGIISLR